MNNALEGKVVRWYIIRSNAGLTIMKVDHELVNEFLKVYGPFVMAEGMSLADVLSKTQWREQAKGITEESISN